MKWVLKETENISDTEATYIVRHFWIAQSCSDGVKVDLGYSPWDYTPEVLKALFADSSVFMQLIETLSLTLVWYSIQSFSSLSWKMFFLSWK